MRTCLNLIIVVLNAQVCLGQNSVWKPTITYTELKENIDKPENLIRGLLDSGFLVEERKTDSVPTGKVYNTKLGLNTSYGSSSYWVEIHQGPGKNWILLMLTEAYKHDYDYLLERVKKYCTETDFSYDEEVRTYVTQFKHTDGFKVKSFKAQEPKGLVHYIVFWKDLPWWEKGN